jgi:hypothetical protein
MRVISLHLLPPMLNTTQLPTLSALPKVCLISGRCFHSAALTTVYQARSGPFHSLCCSQASLSFLRLIIRTNYLRILRSCCQWIREPGPGLQEGPDSRSPRLENRGHRAACCPAALTCPVQSPTRWVPTSTSHHLFQPLTLSTQPQFETDMRPPTSASRSTRKPRLGPSFSSQL